MFCTFTPPFAASACARLAWTRFFHWFYCQNGRWAAAANSSRMVGLKQSAPGPLRRVRFVLSCFYWVRRGLPEPLDLFCLDSRRPARWCCIKDAIVSLDLRSLRHPRHCCRTLPEVRPKLLKVKAVVPPLPRSDLDHLGASLDACPAFPHPFLSCFSPPPRPL